MMTRAFAQATVRDDAILAPGAVAVLEVWEIGREMAIQRPAGRRLDIRAAGPPDTDWLEPMRSRC